MQDVIGSLSGRTVGAYPLSIATSLSFESIAVGPNPPYDPNRLIPDKVDLTKYQHFFINLSTIYRNILGSLTKEEAIIASPVELVNAINFEIEVMTDIIGEQSKGRCLPHFYTCVYSREYKKQNHEAIRLREDKTELQKLASHKFNSTIGLFHKTNQVETFKHFENELSVPSFSTGLIFTHIPFDLLAYKVARRLDLLESHTGRLKPRYLWYTKYHKVPNHELNTLPFTEKLLKIFGDGPMFVPLDIRYRKMILEVSIQCKWTPLTTEAKISADLDYHLKERYLYQMYTTI